MIDFINISKSFGTHEILRDVSFRINAGEKVGITGPNGGGKSTLFKLLSEEITPDAGTVNYPRSMTLGYLHQELHSFQSDISLLEYAEQAVPELQRIQRVLAGIEHRLKVAGPEAGMAREVTRLGQLQTQFEHLGGYELRSRAEATLCGLGFPVSAFATPFDNFSGGWQMRGELARVLVGRPDVLLLDEPTNYLDVPAVEWLESFLESWPGTLLLISHDRYLLNRLTKVTVEVMNGHVTRYPGNYSEYIEGRRQRYEQLLAARRNQDRKREQMERFVERFRSKNTKASQAQSRQKMLDKMETIELPDLAVKAPSIRLAPPPRSGSEVIRLTDAGVTYDGRKWVFRKLDIALERGMKCAVIGSNGMGKTTLLRALAGVLPLSEGVRQVGTNVVTAYQAQDFADVMAPERTVYEIARQAGPGYREADIRRILGSFRFSGDTVEKKVAVLSGGEKVRLALARLLLGSPNFILLDEPTTHLDIPSREALEEALAKFEGTVCLVSHDVEFIRHMATTVFDLTADGPVRYYGGYDYYREKRAAQLAGLNGEAGSRLEEAKVGGERKQQRREEARLRQELATRQRPWQRQARDAEQAVEKLQAKRDELLARLYSQAPGVDYADINRRLAEIQVDMALATERWEEAELALEELRKQAAG